jgi:Tfp pilus assembly protein PilO
MHKTTLKRIALFVVWLAFCFALYLALVEGPLAELEQARMDESRLRYELVRKLNMVLNLELHRRQVEEAAALRATLKRALPDATDDPLHSALLKAIGTAASDNRVPINVLTIGEPTYREFYVERRAAVRTFGDFHDLAKFLHALLADPGPLLRVKSFILAGEPGGVLNLNAELTGYAYLTDEAVAARRKQARERSKDAR